MDAARRAGTIAAMHAAATRMTIALIITFALAFVVSFSNSPGSRNRTSGDVIHPVPPRHSVQIWLSLNLDRIVAVMDFHRRYRAGMSGAPRDCQLVRYNVVVYILLAIDNPYGEQSPNARCEEYFPPIECYLPTCHLRLPKERNCGSIWIATL